MMPSLRCATWALTAASELGASLGALLLPAACAACGVTGAAPLCRRCLAACEAPAGPCCVRCGAPWTAARAARADAACGRCLRFGRAFAFDGAVGLWRYRGPARRLVHAFKYDGRQDLLEPLGRLLAVAPRLAPVLHPWPRPVVVSVPARRSSRRRRGYDQAEGLAAGVARELGLALEAHALVRRRDGGPQAGRSRRQRRLQAAAAFRARPARIAQKPVLLVDDVLSTGATADACARALLIAGASRVSVAVLAT